VGRRRQVLLPIAPISGNKQTNTIAFTVAISFAIANY
jgi:hypothetical protein